MTRSKFAIRNDQLINTPAKESIAFAMQAKKLRDDYVACSDSTAVEEFFISVNDPAKLADYQTALAHHYLTSKDEIKLHEGALKQASAWLIKEGHTLDLNTAVCAADHLLQHHLEHDIKPEDKLVSLASGVNIFANEDADPEITQGKEVDTKITALLADKKCGYDPVNEVFSFKLDLASDITATLDEKMSDADKKIIDSAINYTAYQENGFRPLDSDMPKLRKFVGNRFSQDQIKVYPAYMMDTKLIMKYMAFPTKEYLQDQSKLMLGKPVTQDHDEYESEDVFGKLFEGVVVDLSNGVSALLGKFFVIDKEYNQEIIDGLDSTINNKFSPSVMTLQGDIWCSACNKPMYKRGKNMGDTCPHFPGDSLNDDGTEIVYMIWKRGFRFREYSRVTVPAVTKSQSLTGNLADAGNLTTVNDARAAIGLSAQASDGPNQIIEPKTVLDNPRGVTNVKLTPEELKAKLAAVGLSDYAEGILKIVASDSADPEEDDKPAGEGEAAANANADATAQAPAPVAPADPAVTTTAADKPAEQPSAKPQPAMTIDLSAVSGQLADISKAITAQNDQLTKLAEAHSALDKKVDEKLVLKAKEDQLVMLNNVKTMFDSLATKAKRDENQQKVEAKGGHPWTELANSLSESIVALQTPANPAQK